MMGTPIDGDMCIKGDGMSVLNKPSKQESVSKNNNNAVCYQIVDESVAMGESLTAHIDGNENPVKLLTKVLCSGK